MEQRIIIINLLYDDTFVTRFYFVDNLENVNGEFSILSRTLTGKFSIFFRKDVVL